MFIWSQGWARRQTGQSAPGGDAWASALRMMSKRILGGGVSAGTGGLANLLTPRRDAHQVALISTARVELEHRKDCRGH
jgi:hypothetical protein